MVENVENLILEHLRAVRADIAALREDTREIKTRLVRIEGSTAGLRREQAGDAETIAHLQAQLDRLREDIDRISRRLEITD